MPSGIRFYLSNIIHCWTEKNNLKNEGDFIREIENTLHLPMTVKAEYEK
jgi:hypothetical protein